MVSPSPAFTKKASPGFAPIKAPALHCSVRKFSIIAFTFTHVAALLGSKTKGSVAFLTDSSTMLKNRRTGTYFHSLLLPSRVRAPQTSVPFPVNDRITLIDFPVGWTLKFPFSRFVILRDGPETRFRLTFAGAFQTPRSASTFA